MSAQGAFFAPTTSQFFNRFSAQLEQASSRQQTASSASTPHATAVEADTSEVEPLTATQSVQLMRLFTRWYHVLCAAADLANDAADGDDRGGEATDSAAGRKRQRPFSFLRGDCGEVVVQLPHTRLTPTPWQPQALRTEASPFNGSAATLFADLTAAVAPPSPTTATAVPSGYATQAEVALVVLRHVACTLASLAPVYEAFFMLFCLWHQHRRRTDAQYAFAVSDTPVTADTPEICSRTLAHALGLFADAWLLAMREQAGTHDSTGAVSVTAAHCVTAAQSLFTPPPAERDEPSASETTATTALVSGSAELFFEECERLSAGGRPLAFGDGVLAWEQVSNVLRHIQHRAEEVAATYAASGVASPARPSSHRLRVGTLVAHCASDPRRMEGRAAEPRRGSGTGMGAYGNEDEDDGGGYDVDEDEPCSSLSSRSIDSLRDDGEAERPRADRKADRVSLASARGRPPAHANYDLDEGDDEGSDAESTGGTSFAATAAAARGASTHSFSEQVSLNGAWREHVTPCRCTTLESALLTTYTVDITEAGVSASAGATPSAHQIGGEQCVVFERVAVARPEYTARTGVLHWFSVGRPQRQSDQSDPTTG